MAGVALVVLVLVAAGCGGSSPKPDPGAKQRFAAAADRICGDHLRNVLNLLENQPSSPSDTQQASELEGIYQVLGVTIGRLEGLGTPPNPRGDDFREYVKTLKARAALYRLEEEALLHRDGLTAVAMRRRISALDQSGDGAAQRYGLRVCGISQANTAKAFELGQ